MENSDNSFFGKNGTLQGLINFAGDYSEGVKNGVQNVQGLKSDSAMDRLDSLGRIVGAIVAICCA